MTREEAITELELFKKSALVWNEMHLSESIDMAIEALKTDSVQCKECKHYRAEYGSCTAEHWDLSRVTFPHVEPNDYCSYGENKK